MAMNDEVGSKMVRLLYFVGAGVICTKGINLWRDYERKAAMKAAAAAAEQAPATDLANGAAVKS